MESRRLLKSSWRRRGPPRSDRIAGCEGSAIEEEMPNRPRRSSWPWTRGEDEKLRELALADASTPAIANQLGRTIGAVQSRARRLNITLKRGHRRPAAL